MSSQEIVYTSNQPWGTKLFNKIFLLSPRTWLGALEVQSTSPFRPLDLLVLVQGVLGILVPAIVLGLLSQVFNAHFLIASTLSPWTIQSIQSVIPPLSTLTSNCKSWTKMRSSTSREALGVLVERIDGNRAFRYRRYDVFLPTQYLGKALVFFPGALIDRTAYSEIAALLSDRGIVVVVVSVEPIRLAANHLGADTGRVNRIIQQVEKRHLAYPAVWSLGGHSMGSFAAMRLVLDLQPSKLVMWGSADFPKSRTNISAIVNTRALVVQGSNDKLCQMTDEGLARFKADLPPIHTVFVIVGASHNQFGSYANNPVFDGYPAIEKGEQQRQVCDVTADFLLN